MRDGFAVDKWMLLAVAVLLALGVTMVLSTSYLHAQERYGDGTYFFRKQLFAMFIGMAALVVCSMVPSQLYRRFAYPLLALTFILLVLVLIPGIGASRGGARRRASGPNARSNEWRLRARRPRGRARRSSGRA